MEKLIVESTVGEDLVEMVAVGVGNEDLTELPTGHQMDDLLHTRGIELVDVLPDPFEEILHDVRIL